MKKYFCDLCNCEPIISNTGYLENLSNRPVLCDKTAKIKTQINFKFEHHSGDSWDPPDLCNDCARNLLYDFLEELHETRTD